MFLFSVLRTEQQVQNIYTPLINIKATPVAGQPNQYNFSSPLPEQGTLVAAGAVVNQYRWDLRYEYTDPQDPDYPVAQPAAQQLPFTTSSFTMDLLNPLYAPPVLAYPPPYDITLHGQTTLTPAPNRLLSCVWQAEGFIAFVGVGARTLAKASPGGSGSQTSMAAQPKQLALQCAPNPAQTTVAVSYILPNAAKVTIEITDALQRVVMRPLEQFQQTANSYDAAVSVENLAPGAYTVRLTAVTETGTVFREHTQLIIAR